MYESHILTSHRSPDFDHTRYNVCFSGDKLLTEYFLLNLDPEVLTLLQVRTSAGM